MHRSIQRARAAHRDTGCRHSALVLCPAKALPCSMSHPAGAPMTALFSAASKHALAQRKCFICSTSESPSRQRQDCSQTAGCWAAASASSCLILHLCRAWPGNPASLTGAHPARPSPVLLVAPRGSPGNHGAPRRLQSQAQAAPFCLFPYHFFSSPSK